MDQIDAALLGLRLVFGLFLVCHGLNKVRGGNGLAGTANWFAGIGMRWPKWQARIAATTEIGAGLLFAVGLLTPFAAAAMVGLMLVAIVTVHWKVGFFIFRKGEGWEYCGSIAAVALAAATMGPGRYSLDHEFELDYGGGWCGLVIAAALGVGGALLQLAFSYRPAQKP